MEFDKEVDARGLNCPHPILRLKKALAETSGDRIVRLLATDPSSLKDVEAFAQQTGHELIRQSELPDSTFEFFVRHK
ncbi:MAG: sulfurtransferase TusA family protein [Betaproteobacteria bacterium]|nr:sulfurtransferase TusA family protein [Betaproteobacteria bacterium]